ncbi:class F sortase [Nocardioides sp.]|uniref:class F sortase n=1 Tax=Nocardioides sp. TaxID=35761 RepID=UPI0027364C39|nr:class F sortase [Nocardioides sp.]MDP3892702.1 class F sortase [Nocardioides sp.]
MSKGSARHRLMGVSTRLMVLCLLLMVAGIAMPSPRIEVPEPEAMTPAIPVRLIVPTIELKAPILPIEVNQAGVLYPPDDVDEVGWWQRSAKPGADKGQTVITGHTVRTGGGVMNELGDLEPGDEVRVRTPEGTLAYETTEVFVYTREELAKNAEELFKQDREDVRLVLITCTDWKNGEYQSNIIVFADPVGKHEEKNIDAAGPRPGSVALDRAA